jgi:hypothetical protein
MNDNLDFTYERALKKSIAKLLKAHPCPTCGKSTRMSDIAEACELDKGGFWRFLRNPNATMMPSNLRRIEKYLEKHLGEKALPAGVRRPSIAEDAKGVKGASGQEAKG